MPDTPWIAIPNRRCSECGGLCVLQVEQWLATESADHKLADRLPFKCQSCGLEYSVSGDEASSASGRIDL